MRFIVFVFLVVFQVVMEKRNSSAQARTLSDVETEKSFHTCSPSRGTSGGTFETEMHIRSSDFEGPGDLGGLQEDAPTETNEAHAIAQDRAGRKLLTVRRRLLVDIKSLNNALKSCRSYDKFSEQISKCVDLRLAYSNYREALNDITDSDWFRELSDKICDKYDQCMERFDALESEYMVVSSKPKISESHDKLNDSENNDNECSIEPSDSVSQVSGGVTNLSKASNRSAVRQIEIDKRRADLKITHELQKEKILVKARAEEAEALALAKLRLEEAALDAEEKLLACSERGSSVTSLRSSKSRRSKTEINITAKLKTTDLKTINLHDSSVAKPCQLDGSNVQMVKNKPLHRASFTWQGCDLTGEKPANTKFGEKRCKTAFNSTAKKFVCSSAQAKAETNDRALLTESRNDILPATSTLYVPPDVPAKPLVCESAMQTYLDRQGRNEYVNLASQIAYDGTNMAFVFYENQILRLMDESPYPERRFEVLRASCVGQPREMVNLFFAPMKAMTTSQRIEKALARLKERYGVPAGLTSEPKVREIRHGPSISFNTASLKSFNEELNLLEVYAYAHNELEKLSGQLTLDTANRLPNFLKRRFLDYLTKIGSDLNRPGFDSLRGFVAHELSVSTSDYAQTFFGSDEKGKSRDAGSGGRKNNQVRVRQVVLSEEGQRSSLISSGTERPMESSHNQMKLPPFCFVCDNNKSRHFLADCDKFKSFTPHQKRKTVVEAHRCLNCLSRGHTARECKQPSKCRQCGPSCSRKHTTALHDWFELPASAGAGGACGGRQGSASGAPSPSRDGKHTDDDAQKVKVLKISDQGDTSKSVVLLRTSAVRVINPATGRSTLAYAQHDTASQATLISEGLRNELDLETVKDPSVTIKTLSDHTAITEGRTDFSLESLYTGEEFAVKNALVVPNFTDDENVLPHSVDVAGLDNFNDVEIPTIPERKCIDVLIGQANKGLLTVLHESENVDPNKPNYVLTKLGPIASGGRVSAATNANTSLKINLNANCGCIDEDCCVKLKREIVNLKQSLRESNLENEALQPSRNDERAKEIVESDIKVVDNRYEIPVPLNMAVVEQLPNNYQSALDRAVSMRRSALKNSDLKKTLTDTFGELIDEKWIVPVEENSSSGPTWYLPFFVTKQEKARVVYDGAALHKGMSLNQAVLGGGNLLNNLVAVLIRFRLGRYACIADLSKCFFQVSLPRAQRNLFRIIWFKGNDMDSGELQTFCFTRHVWGINSSPYVALTAIKTIVAENPTGASYMTLNAVEDNRYMDDMLLACDSLADLKTVASESRALFASRGFALRKWMANSDATSILSTIPKSDLAKDIVEVDLGSQPLPDSKALGLIWDPESDRLRIKWEKNVHAEISTRRTLSSKLASLFDPLGLAAPYLLKGKLILQEVAISGFGWDDELPHDIVRKWEAWVDSLTGLSNVSLPRCFYGVEPRASNENIVYQLHGFCDASNCAMSAVIYLRRVVEGKAQVSFLLGKTRLVLVNQSNWVIARKELEAAKICSEVMLQAAKALHHLPLTIHFWTDSQVVLKWIINPDLHLARFVKRRIDKILMVSSPDAWRYVHTTVNPADVGTREGSIKRSEAVDLWLHGPAFLQGERVEPRPSDQSVTVRAVTLNENQLVNHELRGLDQLVESSPDLYTLKKRTAYLTAFKEYFIAVKVKKKEFARPVLNASYLYKAFVRLLRYVQNECFGSAVEFLKENSPDEFDTLLRKLSAKTNNVIEMHFLNELKTLRKLRPCIGPDLILRVEGRLDDASLPVDTKHPIILPGRHALTRLIVLNEHADAGHAGPS